MDELSRRLINLYQGGIPLVERPYASMAAKLDCDESQLISTIKKLLADLQSCEWYIACDANGQISIEEV